MEVTVNGVPLQTLADFYQKYKTKFEKEKARKKKYRTVHKEELNAQAKEYYQRRKDSRDGGESQGTSSK
jgi:hypothetical protein